MEPETYMDLVCHCTTGTSDKVYIVSVREMGKGSNMKWQVTGNWGRRGRSLNSQNKGTFQDKSKAHEYQRRLFSDRLKKGYVDIKDNSYFGGLDVLDSWLKPYLDFSSKPVQPSSPSPAASGWPPPAKPQGDGMFEVICRDNHGMEDSFDWGVEYLAESHRDSAMLWVYDKLGVKREVFKERFESAIPA